MIIQPLVDLLNTKNLNKTIIKYSLKSLSSLSLRRDFKIYVLGNQILKILIDFSKLIFELLHDESTSDVNFIKY